MIPFIIGAGVIIGAGIVLSLFWKEIKDFLQASIKKIQTIIIPSAIVGFRTYLETGSVAYGFLKGIQKFYSMNKRGQWEETTITRTIPDNEVPQEIKAKLNRSHVPVDISNEVEQELELEV
ncbi:MAG: hypothetical protein KGV46_03300 [Pasteurella sp.]|nr:hypothetical protein [Pasteurella sp.]